MNTDERLAKIEHKLEFFAQCYTQLHNAVINGRYIKINDLPLKTIRDDLARLTQELKETSKEIRNESILGTLAFMAKQIHAIHHDLEEMKDKGIKKNIHLDLTLDGYEMIKKKPEFTCDPTMDAEACLEKLLSTLDTREREILEHRYGLSGEKEKSLSKTGNIVGISGSRVRTIEQSILRKCRHPSRRNLVKNITHTALKKDILGED